MSVEILIGRSEQTTADAWNSIRRTIRIEEDRGTKRSPVFLVANTYLKEGHEGLKEITRKYQIGDLPQMGYRRRLLSPRDQESAERNYAGIIFGASLVSIEETLTDKVFDPKTFISRINLSLVDTFVPKLKLEDPNIVYIPDGQWKSLMALVKRDKTLSLVFTDGIDILPEQIGLALTQTHSLSFIQNLFLEPYKQQVEALPKENIIARENGVNR